MKRPWWRVGMAAGLLGLGLLSSPVGAQEEIFERGNQLYQAEDYPAAVEAYEAVSAAGFEGYALYYNLGNAYFKIGELGRSILNWERALRFDPGAENALANLELAATLTADDVEPLPRFWLLSVVDWWVNLLPRSLLILIVGAGWMALMGGAALRILSRDDGRRRLSTGTAVVGLCIVVILGVNLLVREVGLGQADRGVVLAEAVPVRSAPAADDNLTLFEIHEGTRVRIDQRTDQWAEIVLDDGKVGWIPVSTLGVI
jgi:tetratricopeptide (TPR) repeat protein